MLRLRSLLLVLQVQRTLIAPAADVQPRAAQAAPALSRALARVLSATDSKENEAHPNNAAEDNRLEGKISTAVVEAGAATKMCFRYQSFSLINSVNRVSICWLCLIYHPQP